MSSDPVSASDFADDDFVEELWALYYVRLKAAIQSRVRSIRSPLADESQIALSALDSFVQRAKHGQFPALAAKDEMWRLLKTIALRKTNDARKMLRAQKRGGGQTVLGQSDLATDDGPAMGVDAAASRDPSPSSDLEVSDLFVHLLDSLPDDRQRDIVLLRLQGGTFHEIADCLGISTRTVLRTIASIEESWRAAYLNDTGE